jgi:hypothetical protein
MRDNYPKGIVLEGPKELKHAQAGFDLSVEFSLIPEIRGQAAAGLLYLTNQVETYTIVFERQAAQKIGFREQDLHSDSHGVDDRSYLFTTETSDYAPQVIRGRRQYVEQGLAGVTYTVPDIFADGFIDGLNRIADLAWRKRISRGVRRSRAINMLNELTPDRFC